LEFRRVLFRSCGFKIRDRARLVHRHRRLLQITHHRSERATPEAKRDRVGNRAVPAGSSRRQITAATDRRWWGSGVSQQSGSAGALCDGDQQRAKASSRTSGANGHSQWPGERNHGPIWIKHLLVAEKVTGWSAKPRERGCAAAQSEVPITTTGRRDSITMTVILNVGAGTASSSADEAWSQIAPLFEATGVKAHLVAVKKRDKMGTIIRKALETTEGTILAAGGDGPA